MTPIKIFLRILVPGTLLTAPCSCRKLLGDPAPQNQISAAEVYSGDADATNALAGMYSQIMNTPESLPNGGMSVFAGLSADDLNDILRIPNHNIDSLRSNELSATNGICSEIYSNAYSALFTVNSLITGLAHSTAVSAGVRTEMTGEAEFVRALIYFDLVNLYGAVPLVTTTDFTVNSVQPRASVDSVYTQIEADLQDAQQTLSPTYISAGNPTDRTRPNQAAATALLARVWLYRGQWMQAEAAADSVIENPLYHLESDLDNVFLSTSQEAIWQLQSVSAYMATTEGSLFIPLAGQIPAYPLTPELLASWEPGDLRRLHWVDSSAVNYVNYYFAYKYKLSSNNPPNSEYDMVLRFAEIYLIRAEARVEQGNIAGAASDLNVVRQRAGLPPTNASSQRALLTAIAQERRVEFFAECGHRWLDLKRTGQAVAVLPSEKGEPFTATDMLYPIPATQLTANPQLVQNPGY